MAFYFQKLIVKLPFRIFYSIFKSKFGQTLLKIQKLGLVDQNSIKNKFCDQKEDYHKKIHNSRLLILLRDYYDTFYYKKIHRSNLHNFINFINLNILNETLREERPIILCSAHFGRMIFPLIGLSKLGYDVSLITADANSFSNKEKDFQKFKQDTIEKSLSGDIYSNKSVRKFYNLLSNNKNKILTMIIDNFECDYDNSCVRLDFLGKSVICKRGIVKLAEKTKAIIIPYFAVEDGEIISCKFGTPVDVLTISQDEAVSRVYKSLEKEIINYPLLWWNWHLLNNTETNPEEKN